MSREVNALVEATFMSKWSFSSHLLCIALLLSTVCTSQRTTSRSFGIISYADVKVFDDINSRVHIDFLPLGSVVIWDNSLTAVGSILNGTSDITSANSEWKKLSFPCKGWIPASGAQLLSPSEEPLISWSLWRTLPQLYRAGKGVMASKKLGLGWTDQWPIGTGGIGKL